MKKAFLFVCAALVLCAVSCKKKDGTPVFPVAISVSPDVANVPSEGGSIDFEVKGEEEWVAVFSDSSVELEEAWASLSQASGKGAATIKVTIKANSASEERSIVFNVKSATTTAQAKITQAPGEGDEEEEEVPNP